MRNENRPTGVPDPQSIRGSDTPVGLPMIGVVGIGLMGTAVTERLLEHGYRMRVWNRNRGEGIPFAP